MCTALRLLVRTLTSCVNAIRNERRIDNVSATRSGFPAFYYIIHNPRGYVNTFLKIFSVANVGNGYAGLNELSLSMLTTATQG